MIANVQNGQTLMATWISLTMPIPRRLMRSAGLNPAVSVGAAQTVASRYTKMPKKNARVIVH